LSRLKLRWVDRGVVEPPERPLKLEIRRTDPRWESNVGDDEVSFLGTFEHHKIAAGGFAALLRIGEVRLCVISR
jgi:hypothetical protein